MTYKSNNYIMVAAMFDIALIGLLTVIALNVHWHGWMTELSKGAGQ